MGIIGGDRMGFWVVYEYYNTGNNNLVNKKIFKSVFLSQKRW